MVLTLVSPGFWRWIRRYAVRLTGALLILIGITSLAVCWMNALAANPTAVWFLHSSAVEEVGPWWMLLVTVGVWAVLDVSRSYLPSLFTNHLRPWLTPFTMAPTIQTNSTDFLVLFFRYPNQLPMSLVGIPPATNLVNGHYLCVLPYPVQHLSPLL